MRAPPKSTGRRARWKRSSCRPSTASTRFARTRALLVRSAEGGPVPQFVTEATLDTSHTKKGRKPGGHPPIPFRENLWLEHAGQEGLDVRNAIAGSSALRQHRWREGHDRALGVSQHLVDHAMPG